MKLTSENKNECYNYAKKVILTFENDKEIELKYITDYDIDLCRNSSSTVYLTSGVTNVDLSNIVTKKNNVKMLHFEFNSVDIENPTELTESFLDISCNMKIVRYRLSADKASVSEMYIELDGVVTL